MKSEGNRRDTEAPRSDENSHPDSSPLGGSAVHPAETGRDLLAALYRDGADRARETAMLVAESSLYRLDGMGPKGIGEHRQTLGVASLNHARVWEVSAVRKGTFEEPRKCARAIEAVRLLLGMGAEEVWGFARFELRIGGEG
jgi:hypothetical protein